MHLVLYMPNKAQLETYSQTRQNFKALVGLESNAFPPKAQDLSGREPLGNS